MLSARASSGVASPLATTGSSVLLLEPLHFGKRPASGLTARAQLGVAAHHCVVSQHRRQRGGEHLALLVEAADMLCGPQLTLLERLDLAARNSQGVFVHVRLLVWRLAVALAHAKRRRR